MFKFRRGSRVISTSPVDAASTQTGTVVQVNKNVVTVEFDHGKGRALRLRGNLKPCNDKARKADSKNE
jgi:hypothetical protein